MKNDISEKTTGKNSEINIPELVRILGYQTAFPTQFKVFKKLINEIRSIDQSKVFVLINFFNYGFIEGKRAERAKRKHKSIN